MAIVNLTLQGVARGVFNYMFFMLILLLYMVVKKLNEADHYQNTKAHGGGHVVIDLALKGTLGGFICSLILIVLGIPMQWSEYLLLLLPLSLVLSMANIRYLCIAHSAAVLGGLGLLLNGRTLFGYELVNLNIEVTGLLALVGVLHIMEGVLVAFFGHQSAIPVVSKSDEQVILGHIMHHFWPVPLAALMATTMAITGDTIGMPGWWPVMGQNTHIIETVMFVISPLVVSVGYSTITFTKHPKQHARGSGTWLMVYGVLLMGLAYISQESLTLQVVGVLMMFLLHEILMRFEIWQDNRNAPLYPVPERGIRVMTVHHEGVGFQMGLKLGDVIRKVNDIEVVNLAHFKAIMRQPMRLLRLEVDREKEQSHALEYVRVAEQPMVLGIQLIPENPPVLFKVNQLMRIGMVHLMANKKIKR